MAKAKKAATKKAPAKKSPTKKATKKKASPAITSDQRFETEDDLRTLTRADKIRSDKQRMSRVGTLAKEQIKTAKKFT